MHLNSPHLYNIKLVKSPFFGQFRQGTFVGVLGDTVYRELALLEAEKEGDSPVNNQEFGPDGEKNMTRKQAAFLVRVGARTCLC